MLDLSWLEFSCRSLNTGSLSTQLCISRFLCVLGIILSLAIQKALPELTYILKDRLQKQTHDKNISVHIFLLPYCMRLYDTSSGFFRNLARIQDTEMSSEKGLNRGSTLYRQVT